MFWSRFYIRLIEKNVYIESIQFCSQEVTEGERLCVFWNGVDEKKWESSNN